MNTAAPTRPPVASKIALGLLAGAYIDVLDRKDRDAFAMSLLRSIDAAEAELATMDPASALAIETRAAIGVAQGIFDEIRNAPREP